MDDITTTTATPPPAEPELQAPILLYCVFGLPVFITVLWFFLQFTRRDRFGRVDRAIVDGAGGEGEPSPTPPPDRE